MDEITLRPTRREDFPALLSIEQEAFANPWPEEAFNDFLLPHSWTLLLGDEFAGYIFYHGVGDEMVIINIAIRPCYQRRGLGAYLLKESMQRMIDNGVNSFFLDVRVSNSAALALYESFGFEPIGVRKNYYSHPEEDAIVMGKQIL